jgi:sulfur-carrier protein
MGVVVRLPAVLAQEAGGRKQIEVEGRTVGEALRALPVADLLFDEHGELRPLVNVYVDGTDMRENGGVEAPLAGGETLRIVQAVAGG